MNLFVRALNVSIVDLLLNITRVLVLDLVLAQVTAPFTAQGRVAVLLGAGNGSFGPPAEFPAGLAAQSPWRLVVWGSLCSRPHCARRHRS